MADIAGTINWILDLDDSKFKSKLKDSVGTAKSFGNNVGGILADVGKAAVAMGAVAGTAFVGFAALSVKAANEQQEKLAQLNAVLKSTNGIAGVTSKAAIDLSKSLQQSTTYSDEQVLSAENLLLTFTKIGKDTFPDATQAVLDMSTALGQDTSNSAIQLGKALQDPILGVTALRRVGVAFDESQRKTIENLVRTGHTLEAQKLILKEVQTEFGGSAKAATQTFGGALKQLNNSLDDLEETFGLVIINAITPFVKQLAAWAQSRDGQNAINAFIIAFQIFAQVVGNIIATVWPVLINAFISLGTWIANNRDLFISIYNVLAGAIRPIINNLIELWTKHKDTLILLAKVIGTVFGLALLGIIVIIAKVIEIAIKLISVFLSIGETVTRIASNIINSFRAMVNNVIDALNAIIKAFDSLPKQIRLGVTIPQVPHFASGVTNFAGGLATVGENGPETVVLPKGSSVLPHGKSPTGTYNIYLDGVMARSRADLRQIGKDILSAIDEERRARGKATILG